MTIDFNRLHEICILLNDLYDEYSQNEKYEDLNFRLSNLKYETIYLDDLENILYNGFFITKKHIVLKSDDEFYDDTAIPLELLDKSDEEIRKWYKDSVDRLPALMEEERQKQIEKLEYRIERFNKELEHLKSKN